MILMSSFIWRIPHVGGNINLGQHPFGILFSNPQNEFLRKFNLIGSSVWFNSVTSIGQSIIFLQTPLILSGVMQSVKVNYI